MKNSEKSEISVRPDLPLVADLQSKILNLTESLPELKHSKKMFGRQNSQYTSQLMSLTMLGDGPFHFMKQCSAQISNKVKALQGIYFNIKKLVYRINKWEKKGDEYSLICAEEARVSLMEVEDGISHSLREIQMYKDAYEDIREKYGIDEDWDEADFNKLEEENHIRMAFRLALRQLMESGRIERSTSEYMESNGIHPMSGERLARQYHEETTKLLDEGKAPTLKHFYNFLDNMVEMFKGSHKDTMDWIGIKQIIRENSVLLTHDHKDLDYFLEDHGFEKREEKLISDK
jgi:hypothetical protein